MYDGADSMESISVLKDQAKLSKKPATHLNLFKTVK